MWKAFWANCGHSSLRSAPAKIKIDLLNRACLPLLDYRCSRWPPQPTFGTELDRVQLKMAAVLLRVGRRLGETPADFCRRRNRLAGDACAKLGRWSQVWRRRAVEWDDHIVRAHSPHSWPSLLRFFHDADWLNEQRFLRDPCGRRGTNTRMSLGRPNVRWHEGIS